VPVVILFFVFQALGAGAGLVAWMSELGGEAEAALIEGTDIGMEKRKGWKARLKGWMVEAEEKAERVGRRYGVLGYEKTVRGGKADLPVVATADEPGLATVAVQGQTGGAAEKVANAIAAYVVVKVSILTERRGRVADGFHQALLPLRIGLSLALAPSFARFALYPIRRMMGRIKSKSNSRPPSNGNAS
jgi:hypothetical protein